MRCSCIYLVIVALADFIFISQLLVQADRFKLAEVHRGALWVTVQETLRVTESRGTQKSSVYQRRLRMAGSRLSDEKQLHLTGVVVY